MTEHPRMRRVDDPVSVEHDLDLADYCARPACRQQFQQATGRGRRREFCSDVCRRLADKEYKQAKAMVDHFERLARRQRHSVLAFGRSAEASEAPDIAHGDAIAKAAAGVARAEAVLTFGQDRDPQLLRELEALRNAVLPLIRDERTG